jgi:hypothetical protein
LHQPQTFSAFGFPARESFPQLTRKIPEQVLDESQWVSIPGAYVENTEMLKSLAPILTVLLLSSAIGFLPFDDSASVSAATFDETVNAALSGGPQSWLSAFMSLFTTQLPPWLEGSISSVIDVVALLVLIRMTKVIGTDRDCIIAKKVQEVAEQYPVSEIELNLVISLFFSHFRTTFINSLDYAMRCLLSH